MIMKLLTYKIAVNLIIFLNYIKIVYSVSFKLNEFSHLATSLKSSGVDDEEDDINSKNRKTEILKEIFDESYDPTIRPPGVNGTGPAIVSLSLYVRNIENIDDVEMQYRAQITFRQEWVDPRAKYSHIEPNVTYLSLVDKSKIWVPDVFFSNEKEGKLHELMIPNLFTRIFPDGKILQSYRITLLLSCPMTLKSYPLDKQTCPIRMASYGYTTRDVVLKWRDYNSVEMGKYISMPIFSLADFSQERCDSVTSAGSFGCVQINFNFERKIGYYIIQIFCPTGMIVLISWVSFWLEPSATEARVSLGVTAILTIVTQTYGINENVPPASYIKAVDVWTTVCELMVFGALLQFSVVNYVAHFQWKKVGKVILSGISDKEERFKKEEILKERFLKKAKRIDLWSKVTFPAAFLIFNIIYWSYYLNVSNKVSYN